MAMTGWIGISLGDITGVGPEVTLKALAKEVPAGQTRYLLLGDYDHVRRLNRSLGLDLPVQRFDPRGEGKIFVHNPLPEPLPEDMEAGSPAAANAALAWLKEGAQRCLGRELDALVTAPLSKEAILRTGRPFIGQTEYLSELAGARETAMMLLGHDDRGRWLRVALATTHVPLGRVSSELSAEKIGRAIRLAARACSDLALSRARVAVCALNPHAGEGGELGREEIDLIAPAVEAARGQGIDAAGPFAADTLFHQVFCGAYDAVVAMYHDQGLVPLKMVAFEHGVNWTLGLPFVRTSPDHGTAYDIAGRNLAEPSSMIAAIRLARQLVCKKNE